MRYAILMFPLLTALLSCSSEETPVDAACEPGELACPCQDQTDCLGHEPVCNLTLGICTSQELPADAVDSDALSDAGSADAARDTGPTPEQLVDADFEVIETETRNWCLNYCRTAQACGHLAEALSCDEVCEELLGDLASEFGSEEEARPCRFAYAEFSYCLTTQSCDQLETWQSPDSETCSEQRDVLETVCVTEEPEPDTSIPDTSDAGDPEDAADTSDAADPEDAADMSDTESATDAGDTSDAGDSDADTTD